MSTANRNGLLVVGGAVLLGVAIIVAVLLKGHHDANVRASCAPIANPYGTPPAGYSFEKADLKTQQQLEQRLDLKSFEQYGLDITVAWHGNEPRGVLFSFRSPDHSEIESIYEAVGRSAKGAVRHRTIGGVQTTYVDADDGERISWALEGCTVVIADGSTHADGDKLARSVFKG